MFKILKFLLKAYLQDKKYRKKFSTKKTSAKTTQALDSVMNKGYYVWENFYSPEDCADIKNEISLLVEKGEHMKSYDGSDFRIYPGHSLSKKINKFNKSKDIQCIADFFLKMENEAFFTLAAKLTNKKDNKGSGQGWHRDTYRPYQFKAMLYLTDVSHDNGPFQILDDTNTVASLFELQKKYNIRYDQNRFEEREIDVLMDKRSIKTFTGNAGDLILFNSFTIHRGSPISEGTRFALTNYYLPEHYIEENKESLKTKFDLV